MMLYKTKGVLLFAALSSQTDSVKHQQEVLGQTKSPDQLSVEQRTTSATDQDTEKLHDKSKHKKKHVEGFGEKMKNKYTNCHVVRYSSQCNTNDFTVDKVIH